MALKIVRDAFGSQQVKDGPASGAAKMVGPLLQGSISGQAAKPAEVFPFSHIHVIIRLMKLPLAYYANSILRRKADPVEKFDDELKQLIRDMEETMLDLRGLGLAAPQVKRSIRLFITNIPVKDEKGEYHPSITRVFINPKILSVSDETWVANEGCLSIPKLYAEVARPRAITVEAQDQNGIFFTDSFSGWEAKAILHENDHINGVLFIDRLSHKKKKEVEKELQLIKSNYPQA
jgi:peptide deformylase